MISSLKKRSSIHLLLESFSKWPNWISSIIICIVLSLRVWRWVLLSWHSEASEVHSDSPKGRGLCSLVGQSARTSTGRQAQNRQQGTFQNKLIWANHPSINVGSTIVTPPFFFFCKGGSLRNCEFQVPILPQVFWNAFDHNSQPFNHNKEIKDNDKKQCEPKSCFFF